MKIPERGVERTEIARQLEAMKRDDGDIAGARLFSLAYPTRDDVLEVAKEAYLAFFSENALNPMTFPSLRKMEADVVAMALSLLNGPEGAAGTMTSGGSESLLLAVKTARDHARKTRPQLREHGQMEMLIPVTAHPALLKAAHLLDVKPVFVPVTDAFTADVAAARALASDRTILVVGSAPQYPHGVIDPIGELAALAVEKNALCHVDACVGGFFLPWVEALGNPLPPWDFRVPGVTSISADLHKYGYAAKGASVLLYRSRALRRNQIFAYGDWPGGLFGSPSILGTRPGGAIAAAWAVMHYLGREGYLGLAKRSLEATRIIADGVRSIPGMRILGAPVMSILSFASETHDLFVVADRMQEHGWRIDRQQRPTSLHLTISPAHDAVAARFVEDLRAAAATPTGEPTGAAAMYGMLGSLPDRGMVNDAILDFMDGLQEVEK